MGINTLVLEALPLLKDRIGEIRIVHQTGERDYERVHDGYAKAGVQARVEKFIYEMPEMYFELRAGHLPGWKFDAFGNRGSRPGECSRFRFPRPRTTTRNTMRGYFRMQAQPSF